MQLDAMFLQLGIAGAMLLVMYRIAMRWMANERERQQAVTTAETERNRAVAVAEIERTKVIQDGFRADIAAHQAIVTTMGRLGNQFSRIEGKLDTLMDLTPVRELRSEHSGPTVAELRMREASVIVQDDLQETEPERPSAMPAQRGLLGKQTPASGTAIVSGGEYSRTKKR